MFEKISKIKRNVKTNKGMTYVELIVVLGIFATMSSIIFFNYGTFQTKIDIKNLASDIALKIVEAQKSAISGKFPVFPRTPTTDPISVWKPSYGVYFNTQADNKSFVYFTDLNNSNLCDDINFAPCDSGDSTGEFLDKINITKGDFTIRLLTDDPNHDCPSIQELSVVFRRPNSNAVIATVPQLSCIYSYIDIRISSQGTQPVNADIKVYPSGRIQIN